MVNAASGHVSIQYGLRGPNTAVATACASAANAIGDAFKAIQHDDADIMVTGGTEAAITPMGIAGFSNMRALSERNDDPTRASRPFDRDRDGFVLERRGRPAGVRRTRARQGAAGPGSMPKCSATARVPTAATSPSPTKTAPAPPRRWSGRCTTASSTPTKSATSTPTAPARRWAIWPRRWPSKRVFGEHAKKLSISSTKSQLGHLLGASGGVELIFCVLAVRDGVIPPTINLDNPDPECDLDYTPNQPARARSAGRHEQQLRLRRPQRGLGRRPTASVGCARSQRIGVKLRLRCDYRGPLTINRANWRRVPVPLACGGGAPLYSRPRTACARSSRRRAARSARRLTDVRSL